MSSYIFQFTNNVCRFSNCSSTRKKLNEKSDPEVQKKLWDAFRTNNGIMFLLKLLLIKIPITEADSIRAMACKVSEVKLRRSSYTRLTKWQCWRTHSVTHQILHCPLNSYLYIHWILDFKSILLFMVFVPN